MNVTIYTTPTCGYCRQAKDYLTKKGVRFVERDVSSDRAAADEMVRKTGQMGVPVIIVDGQIVVGFDRARLEQLLGNTRPPSFGLSVADASKIMQKHGMPPLFGAFVGKVAPSSAGERAGLKEGDIITEINMKPIRNADDLAQALAGLASGSRVSIVFLRDGQQSLRSEIVL